VFKGAAFDPETVAVLQTAFDEVCAEIFVRDLKHPSQETRRSLALRIIECAKTGERDIDQLKAYAVPSCPFQRAFR
jgi:hypothetical protein